MWLALTNNDDQSFWISCRCRKATYFSAKLIISFMRYLSAISFPAGVNNAFLIAWPLGAALQWHIGPDHTDTPSRGIHFGICTGGYIYFRACICLAIRLLVSKRGNVVIWRCLMWAHKHAVCPCNIGGKFNGFRVLCYGSSNKSWMKILMICILLLGSR